MAARCVATLMLAFAAAASAAAETVTVTQRGRMFEPAAVEIAVGDSVRIVNDDGELLHHAYLEDPAFSFDIGEQAGGSSNEVIFPVAGVFNVFCGIHPKMGLTVTVR